MRTVTDAGGNWVHGRQQRRRCSQEERHRQESPWRLDQRVRMRQAEAAFVRFPSLNRRVPALPVGSGAPRTAEHRPQRRRPGVAYQRGMGERLQEVEGDRKQSGDERSRSPWRHGLVAIHFRY